MAYSTAVVTSESDPSGSDPVRGRMAVRISTVPGAIKWSRISRSWVSAR